MSSPRKTRKIIFKTANGRNHKSNGSNGVPVLPLHDSYDRGAGSIGAAPGIDPNVNEDNSLFHDPFDDIIGAEIRVSAAASGVVPDDTFTISQAVNALGFGKFQIILSFVVGLCWMADSMEVMILSILSPALHCEWGVSQYKQVCPQIDDNDIDFRFHG